MSMVMLAAALSALVLVCHAAPINMAEDPEQPWRLQANEHRDAKLEAELSALKDASAAEAQAAAREKAVGSETLQKADEETHQATKFMTRAERLLASEQALKDEQVGVARTELDIACRHPVCAGPWRVFVLHSQPHWHAS